MLVVIDGTGEKDESAYTKSMKDSFLNQLITETRIYPNKYFRGPTAAGSECSEIVRSVLNWISLNLKYTSQDPVLHLAGFSRGGTIAIAIAQEIKKIASNPGEQLKYDRGTYLVSVENKDSSQELFDEFAGFWKKLNENIRTLALFDAVDRSISLRTDVIPANVQNAFHAVRSPEIGSRRSFGNTGLEHEISYRLKLDNSFRCTHAAMGGVPWTGDHPTELVSYGRALKVISMYYPPAYLVSSDMLRDEGLMTAGFEIPEIAGITKRITNEQQDREESKRVKTWMWDNLRQHGVV